MRFVLPFVLVALWAGVGVAQVEVQAIDSAEIHISISTGYWASRNAFISTRSLMDSSLGDRAVVVFDKMAFPAGALEGELRMYYSTGVYGEFLINIYSSEDDTVQPAEWDYPFAVMAYVGRFTVVQQPSPGPFLGSYDLGNALADEVGKPGRYLHVHLSVPKHYSRTINGVSFYATGPNSGGPPPTLYFLAPVSGDARSMGDVKSMFR